jgi:hypothetical protein
MSKNAPAHYQVDLSSVEVQDGRQVAEVVAMYRGSVLDVAHVGQTKSVRATAVPLIAVGALLMLLGVGLFASDAAQDWDKYAKDVKAAQDAGATTPKAPGTGFGGLGIALLIFGVAPFVAGMIRQRERVLRDYTIGEGHDASFHVPPQGLPDPAEFALVRGGGGDFALNFTPNMTGDVSLDGQRVPLQELVASGRAGSAGGYHSYPIPAGARCRVRHGDTTFHINAVNPGAAFTARGEVDKPFLAYLGGTALVFGSVFFVILSVPEDLLSFDYDDEVGDSRFARYMFQPEEQPEEEPPPPVDGESQDEAGGTGQRHAGEEGKMGNPKAKAQSGLYAMKGPKDAIPQMARDFDPDLKARNAGILGVMQETGGHFLASPFGGAFAVGNDDEDVWGGLTGTEIGEAYGVGGLGLVGTGRGGGGTGEGTIGLGTTGLIGKGAGGGTGSGYGRGSGAGFGGHGARVPQVRQARAQVQGGMDQDIIRRIVRAHENEVRACYMQGLSRNPNLEGRVVVQFVITGVGAVATSVVQSTTLKDRSVANCVASAVKRWKFPKPKGGGTAMVTYPFMLTPG